MRAGVGLQAPETGPDATASTRERERVGFRSGDLVFGRYRLERPLDSRGRVWLSRSPEPIPIAIKFGDWAALERERAALAACAHEHVVAAASLLQDDRSAGLLLEYIPGGDLVSLAGSPARCWLVPALELVAALRHMHTQGFVHRDIKARNVRLDEAEHAKLIDFGSALPTGSPWSRGGTTAEAVDPKRSAGPVAPADDLYALAALLHELLYGCPPGSARGSSGGHRRADPLTRLVAEALADPAGGPTLDDLADGLKLLQ